MATGFVFHELYLWHNTWNWAGVCPPDLTNQPYENFENPETKRRLRNLIEVSGLIDHLMPLKPRPATVEEIARFHTAAHIEDMRVKSEAGYADAGGLSAMGKGSYEIALLAAGGAIVAAEAVLAGKVKNAYALIRPPGHHAVAGEAMGYCLFNNAVVAIKHMQAVHGIRRVATVDWDVHHGNGTQSAFYDDASVLTISLHQHKLYPLDSGELGENGRGAGAGCNINVPLPAGSGDGAYLAAIERVVLPALQRFQPEMIVAPCGFDASGCDPLGRQMVTSEGFRGMTKHLLQAADELCGGRLVATHEGGYSATYVPYCGLAMLEEMAGVRTRVPDPWAPAINQWGGQDLQPHQAAVIAKAAELVARVPTQGRGD